MSGLSVSVGLVMCLVMMMFVFCVSVLIMFCVLRYVLVDIMCVCSDVIGVLLFISVKFWLWVCRRLNILLLVMVVICSLRFSL